MSCIGKPSVLPNPFGLNSFLLVLSTVKSLGLTLRRRRPLLRGSWSHLYTGEFLVFLYPLLILKLIVGSFSLNDMMTVQAADDSDSDSDDGGINEETASG